MGEEARLALVTCKAAKTLIAYFIIYIHVAEKVSGANDSVMFVTLRLEHVSRISNYFGIKVLKTTISRYYKIPVARFHAFHIGPNVKCCPMNKKTLFIAHLFT